MQKLLELLVKTLVSNEDGVSVTVEENEKEITFFVKVDEADIGKVIGKNGKMANSIRAIIKSIGAKQHKKIFVKFGD